MTQFEFESEQAAWEYYLNLDSHHFEEKQHNNIYTDAFEAGAEWADSNPNPEIIKRVLLYALQHTNILLADDWDKVRWNLLIKKAMEK